MNQTEANYERMRMRLERFNISLRRGLNGKVFYAVYAFGRAKLYGSHESGQTYSIRWSEQTQAWLCNPISGTEEEARRILRIALGELEP